ncbi:MAG: hypothetical protein HC884_04745 [Chloroflexaceae bacterium]|nr:hypothetical protein [Chloroflexaceae bacterium]
MMKIRHTLRLITVMIGMFALIGTLAPASMRAQGTYDGNWSGTTEQSTPITFTIANNSIMSMELDFEFNYGGCIISGPTSQIYYQEGVPITGNEFVFEWNDGRAVVSGTFNDSTSASGTFFHSVNQGAGCTGQNEITWTATKEGAAQPEPQPQPEPAAPTEERCFEETGHCISGRIREFWEQNGGLLVFGLPIGPQQEETIEDQPIQVQWFERNRLELQPENERPYDVLLGRLGVNRLEQQGRSWFEFPKGQAQDGCLFFEESGHTICEPFLSVWQADGLELDGAPGKSQQENLVLFGLPVSEPQSETLSDGSEYTVQWFERARFELHPENEPPFNVLLGLLGSEVSNPPVAEEPTPEPVSTQYDGNWRGKTSQGRDVSFTVANQTITSMKYKFDVSDDCNIEISHESPRATPIPITDDGFLSTLDDDELSITITGTFNSDTLVSGTIQGTSSMSDCRGNVDATWEASRQ